MKPDALGTRMKRYEAAAKPLLVPRTPVIIRIDGRAFHTFTKGCARPYDPDLHACMWAAAKAVCADVAGCKLAYVQSDEISLLVTDYEALNTQPHFDYEVAKLCSTTAATASVAFLVECARRFPDRWARMLATGKGLPTFDSRAYNVPREDVANYFIWRQKDAERNSLTMYAQAYYSHKELQGQGRSAKHELLYQKGVNWSNEPTPRKRGVCVIRQEYEVVRPPSPHTTLGDAVVAAAGGNTTRRTRWVVDENIPVFTTPEGSMYIDPFVSPKESP